ncbi:MAG: WYL domain-containing protein [Rhodocyclaceae bacterium]|nr:WYL domain-containing protein [Rhodocyclaceae bacterium]
MLVRDQLTYLVALPSDADEPRQYAMHRFVAATLQNEPARTLPGFDLARYADESLGIVIGQPIQLELHARGFLPGYFREGPIAADQTLEPLANGWTRLRSTVPNSRQLRSWLQSIADDTFVVQPAALREEMARALGAAVGLYTE